MSGFQSNPNQGLASPAPRRLRHRREEVVDGIKQLILREQLRPGDPLPTETELCEAVGASRSSVREAVKTLAALDIVEVRHGHGTYVGSLSLSGLVESLAFRGLLSHEDGYVAVAELVEVRQTLEQSLAGQIVAGLENGGRDALARVAQSMRETAARGESLLELDREFHLLMAQSLGNQLLVQLTGAFWDVHAIVVPVLGETREGLMHTADAHVAIADAAAAGDAEAFRLAIANHYLPLRQLIASRQAG